MASHQGRTPDSQSPAILRKASQRISAQEGSRILEKYLKKPSLQEEEPAPEGSVFAHTVDDRFPYSESYRAFTNPSLSLGLYT